MKDYIKQKLLQQIHVERWNINANCNMHNGMNSGKSDL